MSRSDRLGRELLAYVDSAVSRWPGSTGTRLRQLWLSRRLGTWPLRGGGDVGECVRFDAPERLCFGRMVTIGWGCFFTADGAGAIIVGERVSFNTNVHVNASVGGTIRIGNDCLLGPNVVLRTAGHRFERTDVPIRTQGHEVADILIDDDVWLGANVTVVGGVRIGTGAVIAAGAVVTRDVPARAIAAGVPAKVVRERGGAAVQP